jgi:hypothetical protein
MMNAMLWLEENWEMICICFGIFVNLLGLGYNVFKLCRAGRIKSAAQWIAVMEAAREFEQEAETFERYSAAEKLQYVLSRLRVFTAELGCRFDEEAIIGRIEADIDFSKAINGKDTDRPD